MSEQSKSEYVLENLNTQKDVLEKKLASASKVEAKAIEKELKNVEKQIEKRS